LTSQKSIYLEDIRSIKTELIQLLDGMDYCLDWKPDSDSWSAREVIYHLVDTPAGGLYSLIQGMLSGQKREFDLMPDLNNITPDRLVREPRQLEKDVLQVLEGLEGAVSGASEAELGEKTITAHLLARGLSEQRTVQNLLQGLFARHWRGHLTQMRELREALGM
jgi:hypothetical protein